METTTHIKPVWLSVLRWTARILAVLFVGFFLLMFIDEGMESPS
jgi:hypothetical protein